MICFYHLFAKKTHKLRSCYIAIQLITCFAIYCCLLLGQVERLKRFPFLRKNISVNTKVILAASFCTLFLPGSIRATICHLFSIFLYLIKFQICRYLRIFDRHPGSSFRMTSRRLCRVLQVHLHVYFHQI